MKRVVILLLVLTLSSGIVFLGAFILSDRSKYENSFVRIVPPHAADMIASMALQKGRYSLAGVSGDLIYLRDKTLRGGLLAIDLALTDTFRVEMKIARNEEMDIDSPYFFLQDGSFIKRGNVNSWSVDTTFRDLPPFTAMQPISKNAVVIRTIDLNKRKNLLRRSDKSNETYDVLEKQVDGIFCTDGHFSYSKENHLVIYTYLYRNQFMVLDTNLNVRLKGKTIDTTSIAKISVVETHGKITMSKPPLVVNKGTCADGKYLYINSNLVAKNESGAQSKDRSVIDVYDITDRSYRFSFYIDDLNETKMQRFLVTRNMIIATFPSYIARYDIPKEYIHL
jgi:hypothetical protein